MSKRAFAPFLLAFFLLWPPRAQQAQSAPEKTVPKEETSAQSAQDDVVRITTNLIQLDAVAMKDGKQVTDLTADDFEIIEDGKPQTITHFSYISNVPATAGSSSNNITPKPENNKNSPPVLPAVVRPYEARRTIAIVVDDLGISFESMPQIKQQLRKFVEDQLLADDLVAIIRTGGEVGLLQQFTTDRRLLFRAIDGLRWNPCGRVGNSSLAPMPNLTAPTTNLGSGQNAVGLCADLQGGPLTSTVRGLRFILQAMRALPGRKSMVILSDNLPLDVPDLDSLKRGPIKPQNPSADDANADLVRGRDETQFGNEGVLRRTAEIASRSSVVIYTVDTRGINTTGLTASDNSSPSGPGLRRSTDGITSQARDVIQTRAEQLQDARGGMSLLAQLTGGFMVSNTNDFGLPRILREEKGYYLIGYRPGIETFNRNFHHIKARVMRPGVTLRTREGFYGLNDKEVTPNKPTTRDQMNSALMSPFGATGIEVHLASVFANTKQLGDVIRSVVYVKAGDLKFADAPDGARKADFNLSAILFDEEGKVVHSAGETRTLRLNTKDYDRAMRDGLVYQLDIPVKKPGLYQFRVLVRDATSSQFGIAGQLVDAPNFRNKGVALSGITLSSSIDVSPNAAVGPFDSAIGNVAMRRFHQGSDLLFAYVIYKAEREKATNLPRLTSQVRMFRDGKLLYVGDPKTIDLSGQMDLERITASGGLRLGPTIGLGQYILQVTINDRQVDEKNGTATQWIDFEIVK
jgi:VWFA-related protein